MSKCPLYLDKFVTEPHFPTQVGTKGYYSTQIMPDLSVTGIETKFQPKSIIVADARTANLTQQYKEQTYNRIKTLHRESLAANSHQPVFMRSHNQFIDKVLVEMDGEKQVKLNRTLKTWKGKEKEIQKLQEEFGFSPEMEFEGRIGTGSLSSNQSLPSIKNAKSKRSLAGKAPNINDNHKVRVFNRMSMFTSLLKSTPPPHISDGSSRYGVISTSHNN